MVWIAIAVIFALAWVWAFHREDRHQREPVWMVGIAFFLGVLAFIPAHIIEGWLLTNSVDPEDSLAVRFFALFLVVGPVEEICKFLAVRSWIYSHTEFDEPMDGIVYAVTAATGFAFAENLHFMQGMPEVIWARGPGATLAHILFAGFWGGALGWSKPMKDRRAARRVVADGLLAGIFTHGLFDLIYFCVDRELPANVARVALAALLIGCFLVLRFQMRRAHEYSPFREAISHQPSAVSEDRPG